MDFFVMTSSLIRLFCSCWMLKLQTSLVMLGAMDVWMDMALTVLALDFGGLIDSFVVKSTGRLLHDVGAWMAFHFSGLIDYFWCFIHHSFVHCVRVFDVERLRCYCCYIQWVSGWM